MRDFLVKVADFLEQDGSYVDCEKYLLQAIEIDIETMGTDSETALQTIHRLANIYSKQGRKIEARNLLHGLLERRKKFYGEEHPKTLKVMHNILRAGSKEEVAEFAPKLIEMKKRTK